MTARDVIAHSVRPLHECRPRFAPMAGAARAERELRPGSEAWRRTTEVRTRTHSNPNPNPNSDTNPNLNPSQSPNPSPSPNPIQVRIRTVLDAALAHGHTALVLGAFGPTLTLSLTLTLTLTLSLTYPNQVLGAFGCGAFGNPPADVAAAFARVVRLPLPLPLLSVGLSR